MGTMELGENSPRDSKFKFQTHTLGFSYEIEFYCGFVFITFFTWGLFCFCTCEGPFSQFWRCLLLRTSFSKEIRPHVLVESVLWSILLYTHFELLKCKFSRKLKVFVTNGGFLEKKSLFSIKTTFTFLEKTQIPNIGF